MTNKNKDFQSQENSLEQALQGAREFAITELEDRLELAFKCDDNENCDCPAPEEEIDQSGGGLL